MKIKELDEWPPQEWKAGGKRLAPEDALDGTDVRASVGVDNPTVIALTVTHNNDTYSGSMRAPEELAKRVVLLASGAAPDKTLREIGELDSEVSE
jgi:hypothetical protein